LFSPLLKGDKFQVSLTTEAQNAVPRIVVFFYEPTLPKLEHTTTGILFADHKYMALLNLLKTKTTTTTMIIVNIQG